MGAREGSLSTDRDAARQAVDLELLGRIRLGDERSTELLLDRYRWLAWHRTRQYFLAGSTREDLVQEALIGLFKAIRDFNYETGTPFAAFADLCIKRHISTALKTANRYKHVPLNSAVSLDPFRSDDAPERRIDRALAVAPAMDPAALVVSAEQIEDIRDHLDRTLTALESDVLELMLQGLSYEEMAVILNKHRKGIDNALQRIRTKLRAHLAQSELQQRPNAPDLAWGRAT